MLASLLRIILLTATLKILERGLDKGPIIICPSTLALPARPTWVLRATIQALIYQGRTLISASSQAFIGPGKTLTPTTSVSSITAAISRGKKYTV